MIVILIKEQTNLKKLSCGTNKFKIMHIYFYFNFILWLNFLEFSSWLESDSKSRDKLVNVKCLHHMNDI